MKTKMIGYLVYNPLDKNPSYNFYTAPLTGPDYDAGLHSFPVFRRLETTPDEMATPPTPERGATIQGIRYPIGDGETDEAFAARMTVVSAAIKADLDSRQPAVPTASKVAENSDA